MTIVAAKDLSGSELRMLGNNVVPVVRQDHQEPMPMLRFPVSRQDIRDVSEDDDTDAVGAVA